MKALSVELGQAYKGLDELQVKLLGGFQDALLEELGDYLVGSVLERIRDTKENPFGRDWQEWATGTRRQREKKGNAEQGLLWDSGDLLHSIRAEIRPAQVAVGSPLDYAKWLQEGTEDMPSREFLGFSNADLEAIDIITESFIARIIR